MTKRREFVTQAAALTAAGLLPAPTLAGAAELLDYREVSFASSLSRQKFEALLNQTFHVAADDFGVVPIQLVDVSEREYRKVPPENLDQFTLTFQGPVAPALPDGLYHVEHWLAGSLLLRLMATNGQRYTAAFSLLR
jgi:hypothetical protein